MKAENAYGCFDEPNTVNTLFSDLASENGRCEVQFEIIRAGPAIIDGATIVELTYRQMKGSKHSFVTRPNKEGSPQNW